MRDISLCHPRLQKLAALLVTETAKRGFVIAIGETLRTTEEQDALYAQGRTKPGSIVTNAPGSSYSSYHQWGTAFDIYRDDGMGAYNESDGFFDQVGAIGVDLGLEWGGNWKSIVDKPHFQLPDWGSSIAGIKKLYATPAEFMKTWGTASDDQEGEAAETRVGWIRNATGYWYRHADGTWPADKWETINHHWYLFNKDGYMCTGWHRWDGSAVDPADGSGDWYYFDTTPDGPFEGACWHSRESGAMEIWYVE